MAPGAELGRALCLDELNKKDEARAEYTKIIEKYPGQLVAQYATINLAALHQEDGLLEEARDLYKHLVDSDLTFFERRRPMRSMGFMGSQRLTGNLARSLIVALLEKNPQLRPERSNPHIPPR